MTLKEFLQTIKRFPKGTVFANGISEPFPWVGDPNQVAFCIRFSEMTREEMLTRIRLCSLVLPFAYNEDIYSYIGDTIVNFEGDPLACSNGAYTSHMLLNFDNYISEEKELVEKAFTNTFRKGSKK